MSPQVSSGSIRQWLVLAGAPIVLYAVIYALPVLELFRGSLDRFDPVKGAISAFDFGFYEKFLTDSYYLGVLWRTIRISLVITVICAVAGYPVSYFLARSRSWLRQVVLIFLLIPLVTSPVVVAYGWLILLGSKGVINEIIMALGLSDEPIKLIYREFTLTIGLVHVLVPFMVLAVAAPLQNLDWNLVLAARSLGATGTGAFLRIVLPLSLAGVATGSLIVFSLSMSAYAVPALIAGPQVKVMSELIYEQGMSLLNWPFAAAMSVILLVVTTGVLAGARGLETLRTNLALRRTEAA
ncbi:MAG: ABC transporter permease [Parvibaculaceae bacterium]